MTPQGDPNDDDTTQDEPPDMADLARRYLDLWQEELSAMAVDPAASDAFGRWFASVDQQVANPTAWLASLNAMSAAFGAPRDAAKTDDDDQHREKRPEHGAAGAAAAGPSPGSVPSDVARLAERVAALERQVDGLAKRTKEGRVERPRSPRRKPSS